MYQKKKKYKIINKIIQACRRFVNDNEVCKIAKSASKSPELLARFTDQLLKKSSKTAEEQETDQILNEVVSNKSYSIQNNNNQYDHNNNITIINIITNTIIIINNNH